MFGGTREPRGRYDSDAARATSYCLAAFSRASPVCAVRKDTVSEPTQRDGKERSAAVIAGSARYSPGER